LPLSGFNVIGFISANLGLGAAARTTVRLLLERKQQVSVIDIDPGFGRSGSDTTFNYLKKTGRDPAPYSINLIHLNPPELEALIRLRPQWLLDTARTNVSIPFWELPVVPASWIPTLERMDLILAPTHFIEHMMATQVKRVPVRHYPQTVFFPDQVISSRAVFGLPEDKTLFVTSFEMLSDMNRKNTAAVIDAFSRAFVQRTDVGLVVKVNNPHSHVSIAPQLDTLRNLSARDPRITLLEQRLSYPEVLSLYASCDILVSLHRSEGLGLSPMEAMFLGKPVIATGWSGNMDFMSDHNACLVPYRLIPIPETSSSGYNVRYVGGPTVWAEPDIEYAMDWMRRLADNPGLRTAIGARAAEDMRRRHEECLAGNAFESVGHFHALRREIAERPINAPAAVSGRRKLRVLFQNRINAFDRPGGDTMVMKRLKEYLERNGMTVDFSGDLLDTRQRSYDIVHIFNLTLPQATESFAKNAVKRNVPFVITSLQEDFTRYYHKAVAAWTWFKRYVPAPPDRRKALPPLTAIINGAKPVGPQTSPFAGKAASMLCACGETEAALLRSVFGHDRVSVTRFGSSIKDLSAPASLFEQAFGVRDFVLCVGRVEPRKNQLMLLHALEEIDLPVVFADGGFTYQPDYLEVCRMYSRKGPTIYTGRLSDELLVSAYRACRLHCLPSWYELPGLVSLEAAQYGCNVAASSWGCLPDYLGSSCVWCSPEDPESVRSAVLKGYEQPRDGRAAEIAQSFTWDRFGQETVGRYEQVLQEHTVYSPELITEANLPSEDQELHEFLDRISSLVEGGRIGDALAHYGEKRPSITCDAPELRSIDAIMARLRKGTVQR
jgi:glycosyltransferase involved in cell wall biosynthesis